MLDNGKWSVHGGWRSGYVVHLVMRLQILLLQKTLSGHVLRSCPYVYQSCIGDVGDDWYLLVLIGDDWCCQQ